ncbi:MAG TPA: response regulator [Panacibacter sp.]|nr:response regulator [Panacibacter sp.]HNP44152.1 response regulator [Panacibacter sp.]
MKILIAEDDPIMSAMIQKQLEKESYELSMNKDARDALESLNNFEPDLIITDILMPFTSGLEFIGIIRSSGIKTPILVLSAMDQESTVLEALSLGANDFITKPFKSNELSSRVKTLIGPRQKKS